MLQTNDKSSGSRLLPWLAFIIGTVILGTMEIWIKIDQSHTQNLIEQIKYNIERDQLTIARSQIAVSLINPLLHGTNQERFLAINILSNAGDSILASKILNGLIQTESFRSDSNDTIRIQAIKGLGSIGQSTQNLQTLSNILSSTKKENVKIAAKQAEQTVLFRKLNAAEAFYEQERWKIAAEYYHEVTDYLDQPSNHRPDLISAETYFDHLAYKQAAEKYHDLFQATFNQLKNQISKENGK
jgi:hypothetical protein